MIGFLIFWCVVYLIFGIIAYGVDLKVGTRLKRGWYNLTHKEAQATEAERGFLVNRSAKARFSVACVLSGAVNALILWVAPIDPLATLAAFIYGAGMLYAAFLLGPLGTRAWSRKDKVFETMDKLESGDLKVAKTLKKKVSDVKATAERTVEEAVSHVRDAVAPPKTDPPKAPPVQPGVEEPTVDPAELIKRYTDKRG